jgi:hypothetical protein
MKDDKSMKNWKDFGRKIWKEFQVTIPAGLRKSMKT